MKPEGEIYQFPDKSKSIQDLRQECQDKMAANQHDVLEQARLLYKCGKDCAALGEHEIAVEYYFSAREIFASDYSVESRLAWAETIVAIAASVDWINANLGITLSISEQSSEA